MNSSPSIARPILGGSSVLLAAAAVVTFAAPFGGRADAPDAFARLPLWFEPNTGQADPRFSYVSQGAGHAIYIGATETLVAIPDAPRATRPSAGDIVSLAVSTTTLTPNARWLSFRLLDGNPKAHVGAAQPVPGQVNHIHGGPAEWVANVPTFGRVCLEDVYPGIGLVYYGNQSRFEYDFEVAPGARPEHIAWQIEGADRLELEAEGDLVLHAGSGSFRQHRPVAYQTINGSRRPIDARFVVGASNRVTFALGAYDPTVALVIDPELSLDFSTYLGSPKATRAWAVAADSAGYVYVAGDTFAPPKGVPAAGSLTNFNGGSKYGGDAFVAKLAPHGTQFVYFTYLGGSSIEVANAIAADAAGAAYVTGVTVSTNFPVYPALGALQPAIAGTNIADFNTPHADAFVTKLDAAGLPVYSTYLGGELDDAALGIAVDALGQAHVTGYTESGLFFRVTNEVRTAICTNVFLTNVICGAEKVITNVTTARLLVPVQAVTNVTRQQYSRTEPKVLTNEVWSVVTTILHGSEKVTDGFPLVNAVQTNNAGGQDIFVAKLSASGGSLLYSTYLGGALSHDFGTSISLAADGSAIIGGVADEADFPVTNALQSTFGGGRDAVAFRLDASGGGPIYSTYLGGSAADIGTAVAAGPDGSAYVVGSTASRDFLSTAGRLRPGGVSRSTDAGANWTLRSSGLTHTGIRVLVVHPTVTSTIYAGTPRGVFQSLDAGANWTSTSEDVAARDITALAVNPLASSILYAAGPEGFFRSDDAGSTWIALGSGLPLSGVNSLTVDLVNPDKLHAGTRVGYYVSTNRGTNFVRSGQGLKSRVVHQLVLTAADSSLLYAGTDGGVYQSTNAGVDWRAVNTGLATRRVLGLAMSPTATSTLIAGTAKGIYRTTDAGLTWAPQTNGLGRPQINAVAYDPSNAAVVYAGATNGVFRSADGGVTWSSVTNGLLARDTIALVIDPLSPTTLYAGARGTNYSGGTNDAFLVKLRPDGLALDYGFTFGGTKTDEARAVAVDGDGSAFVAGWTMSRNFPVVGPVPGTRWQGTNAGRSDAFVAQFDPTGSSNVFSIFLGGKGRDTATGLALDGQGGLYVVGTTTSANFVTTNALQRTRVGVKENAFISKFVVEAPAGAPGAGLEMRRNPGPELPFPPTPQAR